MKTLVSLSLVALASMTGASHGSTEAARDSARQAKEAAIREATLRVVVQSRCQVILCLIGVGGVPAAGDLLKRLEPLGRVGAASPDDYVVEDGAVRAFSKRRARLVDISRVRLVDKAKASVEVAVLATGLDSTNCTYHLRLSSGVWAVDEAATQCTIS